MEPKQIEYSWFGWHDDQSIIILSQKGWPPANFCWGHTKIDTINKFTPITRKFNKSQKTHATGRYLHARVCEFATMRRIASIPCLHFEASPRFQLVSPRNSKCTKNLQQRPFLFTTRQSPTSTRMQVAGRPNAYMENSSALSLLASPVGQEFWWKVSQVFRESRWFGPSLRSGTVHVFEELFDN